MAEVGLLSGDGAPGQNAASSKARLARQTMMAAMRKGTAWKYRVPMTRNNVGGSAAMAAAMHRVTTSAQRAPRAASAAA